jgi:uncharacterized protein (TIGR02246 family)
MTMTDEDAIREVIRTWGRASRDGDLNAVVGLMTEDATFLTPGNPPMRGRQAFVSSFQAVSEHGRLEASTDVQEVVVEGRIGYAVTQLTVTMIPHAGGEPMRRSGYVLSVFRKQPDGRWAIARDANMLK